MRHAPCSLLASLTLVSRGATYSGGPECGETWPGILGPARHPHRSRLPATSDRHCRPPFSLQLRGIRFLVVAFRGETLKLFTSQIWSNCPAYLLIPGNTSASNPSSPPQQRRRRRIRPPHTRLMIVFCSSSSSSSYWLNLHCPDDSTNSHALVEFRWADTPIYLWTTTHGVSKYSRLYNSALW